MSSNPTTLAAWKKAAVHDITLASGVEVKVKIPNLPELVAAGEFPNHLVETAISVATGETKVTPEEIKAQAEFYRELVSRSIVEPKVAAEDVGGLPFEDIELIASIATRQRDVDALGHHIAGLDKNKDWRKFRGIDYLDEDLEDV
jgi:hypothetical protein